VGKTSLVLRYVKNSFSEDIRKTIGANFLMKEINFENKHIKLIIWDIAGQSKFEKMRDVYYKGSQGAIGVFDVTRWETMEELPRWIQSINNSVKNNIPMLIIGNKIDLERSISTSEAKEFVKDLNCNYLEASAKTGDNVEHGFLLITEDILDFIYTEYINT